MTGLFEQWLAAVEPMVRAESPSGDIARLEALAAQIAESFRARGAEVALEPAGGAGTHLLARLGAPRSTGRGPLLILGHFDTVHPVGTLDRLPFQVEDDRVTGPGVYDMKGGIAALLVALDRLTERGERLRDQVLVYLTCDEESGSATSRARIEELGRSARGALVLEPSLPGGGVKLARKGVALYHVAVEGVPAHAGIEPEAGASAIHELLRVLGTVLGLADARVETTLNAGTIQGGTASNVVAERAAADVDVRFWTRGEAERVHAAMQGLKPRDPRCTLTVAGGVNRYALEETPGSRALFDVAVEQARALGFPLSGGGTGGASDGNLLAGVGCPTLDGLGPDGGGAHSLHEFVYREPLPARIELLARLLSRL
ncbi:MAG: M20/M25/M40 family metallo-hydrolase [Gemmatimonadota bacterium]